MTAPASKTTSAASLRNDSLDQTLPHYEDTQFSDHDDGASNLPVSTATPTGIRDFLFRLLGSTKAMPEA